MRGAFAVAVATVLVTASGCGSSGGSGPENSNGPGSSSGGNASSSSGSGGQSGGGPATASSSSSGGAGTSSGGPSGGSSGATGGSSSSGGAPGGSSGGGARADAGTAGGDGGGPRESSGGGDAGSVVPPPVGDGGLGGGVENSGASCMVPALPSFSALTSNAKLPDPFKSISGTEITKKSDWTCRRAEVSAELQQFELGTKPPAPSSTTGSVSGNNIVVNVSNGGSSISFTATVTKPTGGTAPFPALIAIGGTSLNTQSLSQKGVAVINFPNDDVAAQQDGTSRGKGKFYTLYGANHSAGAMMAWAWGVSRLIDVLQATPSAQIDTTRLAVSGCSRNGKGALVVGAFDERIGLVIPQESGSGGAGSWRVSDSILKGGGNTQTLGEIIGENVWFSTAFNQFNNNTTKLPFDHHMLEAMVAPRALLVIENNIDWLGPQSTFTDTVAGNTVWQALGITDRMGLSQTTAHNHCQFPASEQPDVDAFVDKFLVGGGTANTAFLKTQLNFTYDKATWQDWSVPALQ
ncbi:MAG: hypothetical protein JOZ69_07295 [Myxococcales bacterium]|nr:hypothetical protein [Myxococcales bacterium]